MHQTSCKSISGQSCNHVQLDHIRHTYMIHASLVIQQINMKCICSRCNQMQHTIHMVMLQSDKSTNASKPAHVLTTGPREGVKGPLPWLIHYSSPRIHLEAPNSQTQLRALEKRVSATSKGYTCHTTSAR